MIVQVNITRDTYNSEPKGYLVLEDCVNENICIKLSDDDREIYVNRDDLKKALSVL